MDLKEKIPNKYRNKIVMFLSSNRNRFPIKEVLKIASYIVYGGKNVSYDSSSNGENKVFEILSKQNLQVIIDCGANEGTNTRMFKSFSPNARVFCIEAIEETMNRCKDYTKDLINISYHNIGMGSKRERVVFKYFPNHLYLSTKYENTTGREIETKTQSVEIFTGDEFCDEHNIDCIDFLKIDVEGMDFEVIKGFLNKLQQKKVKVLQFEYGQNFINAKTFLKDVFDFIKPLEYRIGKIYPNGVEFLEYNNRLEDFLDANYIIVDDREEDLIKEFLNF